MSYILRQDLTSLTDLHTVEILRVLQHHAVSQDQQVANVSHLTGVLRGERGGGVAHWSQNSYGTGGRREGMIEEEEEEKEEKEGIEAETRGEGGRRRPEQAAVQNKTKTCRR